MTVDPSAQPGAFDDRKPISAEEVLKLRAELWSNGSISTDEADRLFDLNRAAAPSREWSDFFVEALTDYLISRGQPRGYVTDVDAQWLIEHLGGGERIASSAELELIVKLLEHADFAPDSLKRFALNEIEQTVLTGNGATRSAASANSARIDDAEVSLLRRLIFAPAGDGPAIVSASEAEMLFRLKDATLNADNSPEWKKLFVQGVANHLMAHQSYVPPSAAEELRLEAPYKADPFGHVLGRIGRDAPDFKDAFGGDDEAARARAFLSAVAADAQVSTGEASWLKRLFDANGARDPLEQALLDFLAEDGVRAF